MSRIEQALLRALEPEGMEAFTPEPRPARPDLRLVSHGIPAAKPSRPVVHDDMSAAWDQLVEQASALARPAPVATPTQPRVLEQAAALARVRTPVVDPILGAELGRVVTPPPVVAAVPTIVTTPVVADLGRPVSGGASSAPTSGGSSAPASATPEVSRAKSGPFVWVPVQSPTSAGSGIIANAIASEQFRKLAGQMIRAQETHGVKVVMITSAMQGEGKSSTSSSLALTLANSYKRDVLLVDADMRLPSLQTMFQLPSGWGLGELLEQTQSHQVSPYQVSQMLGVLAAGRPNRDPVGALTSARMREFIEAASAKYDFVIVDTPPVAVLPDANLLGSMVDAVLLVISAGTTQYEYVSRAVEAITKERILGVVLNRADQGVSLKAYEYSKY